MKRSIAVLLLLSLLGATAGCVETVVTVEFAEPFPADAADLPGFAAHHQGRYQSATDTTEALLLGRQQLVLQQWQSWRLTGRQLDSLALPHRTGRGWLQSQPYRVQALAADSFCLSWQRTDTLLRAGTGQPTRLRQYQGWYYLSEPDPAATGHWQVQRLAVAGRHLIRQALSPDSLRLRALDPAALELHREPHTLRFVVRPRGGHARHQLGRYTGLWQTLGEYRRQ